MGELFSDEVVGHGDEVLHAVIASRLREPPKALDLAPRHDCVGQRGGR